MNQFDYDLFVIGAGSGGVRAARIAAGHGARVGICEESRVGGTCVIRGCVPKKLLVFASQFAEAFEDASGYGWTPGEAEFSWPELIAAKDREIDRLNQIYIKLLANAGVTLHEGRGRLLDAHTVEVNGERVTAERILIAVGGRPWVPDIPGHELGITSDEAFDLPQLPRRILIAGAGYIAVEFAGISMAWAVRSPWPTGAT
jgi:glutathione reductase (NADPH)